MRWLWCLTEVSAVLVLFAVSRAHADFICRSDVSYKWVKAPSQGGAHPTPDPAAAGGGGETTVRFAAIERAGKDEAAAKTALLPDLNRTKVRATEACKKEHENLAGCVASKFGIQAGTLASLSFSARRELEKAIASDCQAQLGTCLTAVSSDPVCEELKALETPTPAAAAGTDKKKK